MRPEPGKNSDHTVGPHAEQCPVAIAAAIECRAIKRAVTALEQWRSANAPVTKIGIERSQCGEDAVRRYAEDRTGAVATRIASGAVKQTIPSQDQTGCRVLSGHISKSEKPCQRTIGRHAKQGTTTEGAPGGGYSVECVVRTLDRKSTRLNSSHTVIYTLSLHDALPISAP